MGGGGAVSGTLTEQEIREYDSGYRDGAQGLSLVEGESEAYTDGWFAGRRAKVREQHAINVANERYRAEVREAARRSRSGGAFYGTAKEER
jgi:hypothetical protein